MTESQKLERLKVLSGETDESVLSTFLDLAGLDHHFTTFGGTRKPGTDLLVIC